MMIYNEDTSTQRAKVTFALFRFAFLKALEGKRAI